ncbi:solute carrier family 41 member 2 isoform X2 [Larimichthys crocea]|uniref:solute carrier family 41 member 2 isoform X2 n=1 Tax=Larimichthys crocea TaxID=215358 RepID=UPI000F5DC0E5|nr:solute carrier family 41 member 2 isoform X2 [Larimichthys crocea]
MVVSGSQDEQLPRSGSEGRGANQQNRPNPSVLHHSGHPHLSSNGNISPVNTSLNYEPQETDFLLPNKLYSRSRLSDSMREKDVDDSGAPAETICSMLLQILVPFLLAGFGTVSAGMLLEVVQNWDVFQEITEIFILVPAVLGMKGNLEMTLASRLSTAVNAGKLDSTREKWMLIVGNLALKQLQATVLGLLASLMATVLGWMAEGKMPLHHLVLLCSTSVSTAFMASLLQGIIMVGVIIGSKRLGINPDNVATPMAASFGDLITLALLACFSQWFYSIIDLYSYVLYLVDLFFLCLIPLWVVIASKHPASHMLLRTGWEPIITAMVISSIGGLILDKTVSDPNLAGIIVYAPVITGANHRSAQILLLLVMPGQLVFIHIIHLMKGGHTLPSPLFTVAFLSASLIQVFSLLCIADCMVHCLWRRGKDPDSYSIPYLTALGDLLGTALLSLAFLMLWCIGDSGSV